MLPERYQQLITGEINRILREMNKDPASNEKNAARLVWRREYDYQSELEQTRMQIVNADERALEAQKRCDELELQARIAEERFNDAMRKLSNTDVEEQVDSSHDIASTHAALMEQVLASKWRYVVACLLNECSVFFRLVEYSDDADVEGLVLDAAAATNRGRDKATEWILKLHDQDIMTVGDLSGLEDEDWAGLGLTVFALRALKNTLKGKRPSMRSNSISDVDGPGSLEDVSSAIS